jgi:hypothetical protein
MSAVEDPDGREHVGDEYVTYNRHKERRPIGLTFLLSLPVQRKRKRHTKKQREEKSVRLRTKHRGCWVTDMSDQRAVVRPPWNQRKPSCRLSVIC